MKQSDLKALIRECLREVLVEARRICAWCNKDLGVTAASGDSHGICPTCLEKQMGDLKQMKSATQHAPGTGAAGLPSKAFSQTH